MKKTCLLFFSFLLFFSLSGFTQDYAGVSTCGNCHNSKHADWVNSGHHYKLNEVSGAQAPIYPFEVISGTSNVIDPPATAAYTYTWGDVAYVIGGYSGKPVSSIRTAMSSPVKQATWCSTIFILRTGQHIIRDSPVQFQRQGISVGGVFVPFRYQQ